MANMGVLATDDPLRPKSMNASGFFLDAVERNNTVALKNRGAHRETFDAFALYLGVPALLERFQGGEHAREMVMRELLTHELVTLVTREMKSRAANKGGWKKVGVEVLQKICKNVCDYKLKLGCLKAEVANRLLAYNLLHSAVPVTTSIEEQVCKRNRLEEFWAVYRNRNVISGGLPNNDEGQRVKALPKARQKQAMKDQRRWRVGTVPGPVAKVNFSEPGRRSWRLAEKGPRNAETLSVIEASPVFGKEGKALAVPQKVKYGMAWDPVSRSMSWGRTSPKDGTIAEKALLQSMPSREMLLTPTRRTSLASGYLPPVDSATSRPLRSISVPSLADEARSKYLRDCDVDNVVPAVLSYITGHSDRLEAAYKNMADQDLLTLNVLLEDSGPLTNVRLDGNTLLTDKSLANFLRSLRRDDRAPELGGLALAWLYRAGAETLDCCLQMTRLATSLVTLDMSGITISTRFQLPLCQAIGEHRRLQAVALAQTGLGITRTPITQSCITALLKSASIDSLNLSWNCLHEESYEHLGECLSRNRALKVLSVSTCSSATLQKNCDAPVNFFLEKLPAARSLQRLDISCNRMDYRTALVLEDAMELNKVISYLNCRDNPLGTPGLRSILRMIARSTNVVETVETEGTYVSYAKPGLTEAEPPVFSYTNPGAKYVLDLARPYHRSVLRMLYKKAVELKIQPQDCFTELWYSSPPFHHATKDTFNTWEVPTQGTVKFLFNIEKAIETAIVGVDDWDLSGFLNAHYANLKLQPCLKKARAIYLMWKRLTSEYEHHTFVDAMSQDFLIDPMSLEFLCMCKPAFISETILRLLPAMAPMKASLFHGSRLYQTLGEFVIGHEEMAKFYDFNACNPTGHYKLDLSSSSEREVGKRLLLLDRWETSIDRRRGRFDISQRNNRSHCRNEMHHGRALFLSVNTLAEWTLPDQSIFELDYVSGVRPPKHAAKISDDVWGSMLVNLFDSDCSPKEKINTLREISHLFYVSALQVRELLGAFKTAEERAECVVIFVTRLIDIWNGKVFRVRFENQEEVNDLRRRLGYAFFNPWMQPENSQFNLHLGSYDQRLVAVNMIFVAQREKAHNIRNPQYIRPDGSIDPLTMGVPRSWEHLDKIPKDGVIKFRYVCAPEDRKYDVRRQTMVNNSYFDCPVAEEDVIWWTGLNEVPEDMIELLEFMIGDPSFQSANKVFQFIDGVGGNGEISFSEFKDGIKDMGCQKFKGADMNARINAIFRYLDPGGEGTVSLDEWQVFTQLWREFELSVHEFVSFLIRMFGDDLNRAWTFLDDDGSGELDFDEWMKAVDNIGYFGPTAVVFNLLDNSDDGNISIDEFLVLERYIDVPASVVHYYT